MIIHESEQATMMVLLMFLAHESRHSHAGLVMEILFEGEGANVENRDTFWIAGCQSRNAGPSHMRLAWIVMRVSSITKKGPKFIT